MTVSPPIVSLGEAAQIKVEVRDAKRPAAPDFPPVDGLKFSGTGQSSQTRIVNGKVDKSVSYTITVYPQKTGEFAIGPFNYNVNGETKQLSGKLKVVATSGEANSAQSWSDLVFAKVTSSRKKAYVQEPFELTLAVYSQPGLQIQEVNNLKGLPETGLTTETKWQGTTPTREQIDRALYDVRRFKASMRAVGSGEFTFAPTVTVQVVAPQQKQQRRDPFGFGMFNSLQTIPVELNTDPVTIDVLPLPTLGKPAGFSGVVGRFQFQVTADPIEVAPGDPITLQMTILGEGNYDRIQPPALPIDASFRLFGDAVRQQGNNGVRFEQVISPRDSTLTEIPPIAFSFFDTETGQYRTVTSRAIPINVTATSNEAAQIFAAKETLVVTPADQPFATESDLQRILSWLHRSGQTIRPWLWTIPAVLLAGLLLFFAQKFYHWRRKDIAWIRRQKAPKAARQALRRATQAKKQGDATAFYNALWDALADYFGNRLNLAPGDVSAEIVLQALRETSVPNELLDSSQTLFEQVDAARYSRASTSLDIKIADQQQTDLTRLLKNFEPSL